jgi:hypothetical protein
MAKGKASLSNGKKKGLLDLVNGPNPPRESLKDSTKEGLKKVATTKKQPTKKKSN